MNGEELKAELRTMADQLRTRESTISNSRDAVAGDQAATNRLGQGFNHPGFSDLSSALAQIDASLAEAQAGCAAAQNAIDSLMSL